MQYSTNEIICIVHVFCFKYDPLNIMIVISIAAGFSAFRHFVLEQTS